MLSSFLECSPKYRIFRLKRQSNAVFIEKRLETERHLSISRDFSVFGALHNERFDDHQAVLAFKNAVRDPVGHRFDEHDAHATLGPFSDIRLHVRAGGLQRIEQFAVVRKGKLHDPVEQPDPDLADNKESLRGKRLAVFTCYSGGGAEKAIGKLQKLLEIDSFEAELILTDPKNKPSEENEAKLDSFCAKIKGIE